MDIIGSPDCPFTKETNVVRSSGTHKSLIRDAGSEKLMQRFKRIESEQKELEKLEREKKFEHMFFSLADKFFKMKENEIRGLDEDEFNALRSAIARRVKRRLRTFWFVNGFSYSALAALCVYVSPGFLVFSAFPLLNITFLDNIFQHHFSFSSLNKRNEKLILKMLP